MSEMNEMIYTLDNGFQIFLSIDKTEKQMLEIEENIHINLTKEFMKLHIKYSHNSQYGNLSQRKRRLEATIIPIMAVIQRKERLEYIKTLNSFL